MKNFSQCLSLMTTSSWVNTVPRSVENAIRQQLRGMQIMAVEKTPINGLYDITTKDNQFFCDATGRYFVVGEFCTAESLTRFSKNPFRTFKMATTHQDNL